MLTLIAYIIVFFFIATIVYYYKYIKNTLPEKVLFRGHLQENEYFNKFKYPTLVVLFLSFLWINFYLALFLSLAAYLFYLKNKSKDITLEQAANLFKNFLNDIPTGMPNIFSKTSNKDEKTMILHVNPDMEASFVEALIEDISIFARDPHEMAYQPKTIIRAIQNAMKEEIQHNPNLQKTDIDRSKEMITHIKKSHKSLQKAFDFFAQENNGDKSILLKSIDGSEYPILNYVLVKKFDKRMIDRSRR